MMHDLLYKGRCAPVVPIEIAVQALRLRMEAEAIEV
jgi:hypothetical protein